MGLRRVPIFSAAATLLFLATCTLHARASTDDLRFESAKIPGVWWAVRPGLEAIWPPGVDETAFLELTRNDGPIQPDEYIPNDRINILESNWANGDGIMNTRNPHTKVLPPEKRRYYPGFYTVSYKTLQSGHVLGLYRFVPKGKLKGYRSGIHVDGMMMMHSVIRGAKTLALCDYDVFRTSKNKDYKPYKPKKLCIDPDFHMGPWCQKFVLTPGIAIFFPAYVSHEFCVPSAEEGKEVWSWSLTLGGGADRDAARRLWERSQNAKNAWGPLARMKAKEKLLGRKDEGQKGCSV